METPAIVKARIQLEAARTATEQIFYSVLLDLLDRRCFNTSDALIMAQAICADIIREEEAS